MILKEPIYVYEEEALDVFETVEYAERYLEPPDVINDIFEGYDAEGRLLKFSVVKEKLSDRCSIDVVRIELAEETPTHASRLADILKLYLKDSLINTVPAGQIDAMKLEELVAESLLYTTESMDKRSRAGICLVVSWVIVLAISLVISLLGYAMELKIFPLMFSNTFQMMAAIIIIPTMFPEHERLKYWIRISLAFGVTQTLAVVLPLLGAGLVYTVPLSVLSFGCNVFVLLLGCWVIKQMNKSSCT